MIFQKPLKYYFFIFFTFYLSVAAFNDGFIAFDEYYVGISRYIPAQNSSIMKLVGEDDVKSPMQMLPMLAVSKAAFAVGVESPYFQYRIVIFILALISVLIYFLAFFELFKIDLLNINPVFNNLSDCNFSNFNLDESSKKYLILLFTFYFGGSFALTRPMYESIAAPWLFYSAIKAFKYQMIGHRKDLLEGVLYASMSFCLRPQLGFCALIFLILPLFKKKISDLFYVSVLGAILLFLSGLPDLLIRGKWHHSLLQLIFYNYEHGADYGQKPISFYPIMFLFLV